MTRVILIPLNIFCLFIFIKSSISRGPSQRRNGRQMDEMKSEIVTEPITTPVMIKDDMSGDVIVKDKVEDTAVKIEDKVKDQNVDVIVKDIVEDNAVKIEDKVEDQNVDVNEIKEDFSLTKCYKCNKPSYKYKKPEFCGLCVQENLVESDDKEVNCKKCRKFKYREKNSEFCSDNCPDAMKRPLFPAQQAIAKLETGEEADDEGMEEEIKEETTTTETSKIERTTASLGIMGSIYKFLVHANTWDFRPETLPQAQVEAN